MLKSHMDLNEQHLISISKVPANSGHTLHKGTPREAFIREYLEGHLPSNVAIGTGEIIDVSSKPGQSRNQYDIVIMLLVMGNHNLSIGGPFIKYHLPLAIK